MRVASDPQVQPRGVDTGMIKDSRSSELEYMAMGIVLGAILGFLLFVLLGDLTLGLGLGVGIGLILSDVIYRRISEVGSGR